MKKLSLFVVFFLTSSLFVSAKETETLPRFALGVEGGTTGVGGSVWFNINEQLSLSAAIVSADENADYSTGGIDYDGNVDLSNEIFALNWHPGKGGFHFTVGMILTDNQITIEGAPEDGTTYDIGGVDYSKDIVGSLVGNVSWEKSSAPYIGIGYAKKLSSEGVSLYVNAGVMDSGVALARLEATGAINSNAEFQDRLRTEEDELNEELEDYEIYPVIRIGLVYRF